MESDGTLKVIKNESIGRLNFDPGYSTSITGVTDVSSTSGTRYSSISTDYCYQNSGIASNYHGCKIWGSNATMLDSSGNHITKMPREISDTEYDLPSSEAYINTYLNNTWYNGLNSDVKNLIVSHMFNVGLVKYNETSLANTLTEESYYKWNGKVGLMNVSDYVKASTNSACISVYAYAKASACYNDSSTHNWIYSLANSYTWFISPQANLGSFNVTIIHLSGYLTGYSAYDGYYTLPVSTYHQTS